MRIAVFKDFLVFFPIFFSNAIDFSLILLKYIINIYLCRFRFLAHTIGRVRAGGGKKMWKGVASMFPTLVLSLFVSVGVLSSFAFSNPSPPASYSKIENTEAFKTQWDTDCDQPRYFMMGNHTTPPAEPKGLLSWQNTGEFQVPRPPNDKTSYYSHLSGHHPCRTEDLHEADLIFVCCYNNLDTAKAIAQLPVRDAATPYVVWTGDPVWHMGESAAIHCFDDKTKTSYLHEPWCHKRIVGRKDIQFFGWDLRDYTLTNDMRPPLPGVTLPPRGYFFDKDLNNGVGDDNGSQGFNPYDLPEHFFTFKGAFRIGWHVSSFVRENMMHEFDQYWNRTSRTGVIERTSVRQKEVTVMVTADLHDPFWGTEFAKQKQFDFKYLMDTVYAAIPRGHSRWTRRFGESIGAGAIPVILSDGYTMPFAEIIDWSQYAIVLKEASMMWGGVGSNIKVASEASNRVIAAMPGGASYYLGRPEEKKLLIAALRKRIYDLNLKWFNTPRKRLDALLASLNIRRKLAAGVQLSDEEAASRTTYNQPAGSGGICITMPTEDEIEAAKRGIEERKAQLATTTTITTAASPAGKAPKDVPAAGAAPAVPEKWQGDGHSCQYETTGPCRIESEHVSKFGIICAEFNAAGKCPDGFYLP